MLETTENFVSFGSALEPIEEDEVPKKKPMTIADQIAVDDQGRRRFHGAFTGGFSAGYFNTVGSKEGWTPSTFKSTRKDRTSFKNQNVTDFMDDEDMGAFGIAPQIVRATGEFDQDSRKRQIAPAAEGPIPGVPVLEQLIQPVKETVGVRILLKLGWRHGKGLGPKIQRKKASKKKREKDVQPELVETSQVPQGSEDLGKVYGCALPADFQRPADSSDSEADDDYLEALAPEDTKSVFCDPKENVYGLGYTGLDRNALSFGGGVSLFQKDLKFRVENRNLSIKGEAFGIGAFEDDDEEVYSREDVSNYDFALETPEERRNRRSKEKSGKLEKVNPADVCIVGFVKAKIKPVRPRYYPPPALPEGFVSKHLIKKSRFESTPVGQELEEKKNQGLDRHRLTLEERQVLLGDAINKVSRRDNIENQNASEKKSSELLAKERTERLLKFTEILEANKPKQDSDSFKPFLKNPEKQIRYEKYRTLVQAGFQECLKDLQPSEMTEWEREREELEFKRAASLYKPMSGVISSRFVSANSHDISNQPLIKEVKKERAPTEDPKVAANMNLFGKLTHDVLIWHPDRLLCKRFNVPHPYPDSKFVGVLSSVKTKSEQESDMSVEQVDLNVSKPAPEPERAPQKKSLFDNIDFSKPPPGLPAIKLVAEGGISSVIIKNEIQSTVPDTTETNPSLDINKEEIEHESERPSIDLFKEIFANTSSESESEDEISTPLERSKPDTPTTSKSKPESRVPQSQMNQKREMPSRTRSPPIPTTSLGSREVEEPDDYYGPRLPSTIVKSTSVKSDNRLIGSSNTASNNNNDEEEDIWIDKASLSKSHKSKSKRSKEKHKSKRHKLKSPKKHKHKRKSKTKSKSSESDQSDSDDDSTVQMSETNRILLSKLKSFGNMK